MKFAEMKIHENIIRAVEEMGFEKATPIQSKSLPFILEGRDVIGQAQTGTGKTAAFAIPIIDKALSKKGNTNLIIAPTRELAEQIQKEINKISQHTPVKTALIIGGVDYAKQRRDLKNNPDIIVGTPGRIRDHINRKTLTLGNLHTFVLDEADEMLKQGFKEEIDDIITHLPKKYQSLLFSATMNNEVKAIAEKIMQNPEMVKVSSGKLEVKSDIEQLGILVNEGEKLKILLNLIKINGNIRGIIFGRTKRRVDELAAALNKSGIPAKGLHGDLSQRERSHILNSYKKNAYHYLVATDVAARGIDIEGINLVINFDIPQEVEFYVHRVGRTGRAGKTGQSISFIKKPEIPHIEKIMKETKSSIEYIQKPTEDQVNKINEENIIKELTLISDNPIKNKEVAKTIAKDFSKEEMVNILTTIMSKHIVNQDIQLTAEPGVRVKENKGGNRSRNRSRSSSRRSNYKGRGQNSSRGNKNNNSGRSRSKKR